MEHVFNKSFLILKELINDKWEQTIIEHMIEISKIIQDYFTDVMVMVEEDKVRNNRLAFLAEVDSCFKQLGNFKQIII